MERNLTKPNKLNDEIKIKSEMDIFYDGIGNSQCLLAALEVESKIKPSNDEFERKHASIRDIESFAINNDEEEDNMLNLSYEEFEQTLLRGPQKNKTCRLNDVRARCKIQAEKFGFNMVLFDRIPMFIFRYLTSSNAICENDEDIVPLKVMLVFTAINNIKPELIAAFYLEGGQSKEIVDKLLKFFQNMIKLYNETETHDLIGIFGSNFAFHLIDRKLKRIDNSIVDHTQVGIRSRLSQRLYIGSKTVLYETLFEAGNFLLEKGKIWSLLKELGRMDCDTKAV